MRCCCWVVVWCGVVLTQRWRRRCYSFAKCWAHVTARSARHSHDLLCRRSCSLILWCSGTLPISQPIVVVPLWTSFSSHQLSHATSLHTLVPIAVHLHPTTCCVPFISTFPRPLCLPTQPSLPPCPAYVTGQLWLPLVISVSLSGTSLSWPTFHAHSPTFLYVYPLWTPSSAPSPKSSSRRRPTVSRPRKRQPLWWNDACFHSLVARNGSWRDFRRSGSQEDQARFRLVRQQSQHSTYLQDPLLERVAWICDVPVPPCSEACVLSHPSHLPVPCCYT